MPLLNVAYRVMHRLMDPAWRVYVRLRRGVVDRTVVFNGRPLVRCPRGAELRFESGARINSKLAANPIMSRSRATFCCVAPNARLIVGKDVGVSSASVTAAIEVIIGEGSILGADCLITDTDYHTPAGGYRWSNDVLASAAPVSIGRGCFIGARAIILKGVSIGDGAVVAAGAVVTKDVEAGHLAVGNPASTRPLKAGWKAE